MKLSYSTFACALLASGWADLARTADVGAGGGSIGCTGPNEWFSPYRSTFEAHERGENLEQLKQPGTLDDSEYLLNPDFSINNCQTTRYYYLDIHETRAAPDGFEREMFLFNGRINGPLIEANQGDTIVVYVHNYLDVGTTVHWHGLAQNGTGWADGPLGVTQCPIPPGTTFVYKYTLSRPDQCGTYWYHAHRLAHYGDGLVAPLIVHCPGDPLKRGDLYDIDQVVVIQDHYHPLSTRIVNSILVNGSFEGSALTPSPNSGLINGRGRYDCSFAAEGSVCTDNTTLTEFNFPKGSRVRLRLINASAHAQFLVSVDEHPLNVVEADDTPVWQTTVHRAPINIGQRYSSIINTADNNDGDSFWMRADINTACFGANFTDLNPEVKAIIRIGSASSPSSPSSENGSNPPSQRSPGDSSNFPGDQSGDNMSGSQQSSNNNGTGAADTPNGGGDGSTDKPPNSTGDGPNGFGGHDTSNSGDVPDGSDRSDNSDDSDTSGDGENGTDDQDNSAGSDDSGDQQGSQAARLSKRNNNNNNSESNTNTNQNLPTSTDWSDAVNGSCHDLAESTLVPRVPFNPPGANVSHEFRATILTTPSGATGFAANNVSFETFVDDPFLFRVNRGDDIPAGLSASIVLDDTSLAHDIIINNLNPVDHPFHLHGVQMYLIARGNGTVNADSISSVAVNLNNPIRRDTISVTGNTYVIIRVIPDNPGVWAFHCHILYHQLLGLMGVVVIRPDLIRKMEIPQHARDLCTRGSSLNDTNNQNPQVNIEPGRRVRRSINPLLPTKEFVRKRLSLNQD